VETLKKTKLYRWVFLFFLSIYFLTAGGHYYSTDGETMYMVTRSLVSRGTFFVSTTGRYPFKLAAKLGPGHHGAAVTMPAQSALMAPLYLIGLAQSHIIDSRFTNYLLQLSTSFFNTLVTALIVAVFFLFLQKLGYGKKTSIVTTLIFGLATLMWPYSKLDFSEPLLTLFLFSAIYFSYLFQREGKVAHALLAGGFLGLAEATKVAAVIVIIPIGLYFLWLLYGRRRDLSLNKRIMAFILFSLGLLLFFSVLPGYNYLRYGALTSTGYGAVKMNNPIFTGLYGLLFSTGKGLLFYSPPFLLFFLGWKKFYRRQAPLMLLFTTLILTTLFFFAPFEFWHGDVAWGPRYLLYLIPLFLLPSAEVVSGFKKYKLPLKALIVFLIGAGVFVQLVGLSSFYNTRLNEALHDFPNEVTADNMGKFYFTPKFSPIYLETKTIYRNFHNWNNMMKAGGYEAVPPDAQKIFTWFLKPVPDYWWVYYSLSSLSRKLLFILIIPLTSLFISGRKLWGQLRG